MSAPAPEALRIEVGRIELGAVRWLGAPGNPVVFAIHGMTANAWSWSAVARHIAGRATLVAVDLRGRGMSSGAEGPYGVRQHADDVADIIRRFGAASSVVAGHSLGADVALAASERHPTTIGPLVLIDGGAPIAVPDDVDPAISLDDLLGLAIQRLGHVWADRVAYRTMWSRHPAFAAALTPEIERYLLSDLVECDGGFRSCVSPEAVRTDGGELLSDPDLRAMLDRHQGRATILRAETGLLAAPPPLYDDSVVARFAQHDWRTVAGSNHYTVLIGEDGAAAAADAIVAAAR